MSQIHIELKNRLPYSRYEMELYQIIRLYEFCCTYFTEDEQVVAQERPASETEREGHYLQFHYLPESKTMRVQFFANMWAHTPFISFVCTPEHVHELRYARGAPINKTYRLYGDVVNACTPEWALCSTDAPRSLNYLSREKVPLHRTQFEYEVREALQKGVEKEKKRLSQFKNLAEWEAVLHGRHLFLIEFIGELKFEGFEYGKLSPEFLRHLTCNWAGFIHGMQNLIHPTWADAEECKAVLRWLGCFSSKPEHRVLEQFFDLMKAMPALELGAWREMSNDPKVPNENA